MAQFEIKWEAPEYEHREKGVSWYWISIIVAATIVAFSVWQKNFLFGLFVVIAEILFIFWGNRVPHTVSFVMNEEGIELKGGKLYLFKEFESVSIDTTGDGWAEIFFTFRAKLKTPLKILFPGDRLEELQNNIKAILKEIPHEPTLIDSIEKISRF